MDYIYIYRMTADNGFAPCVEKGLLSLACCKGGQMRGEKVINTGLRYRIGSKRDADYTKDNVYIIGTYHDKLLYYAKITDVVTMEQYFSELSKGRTDNIYCVANGRLERNDWLRDKEVHTDPDRIKKDIAGKFVLLSRDYLYLGKDAIAVEIVSDYNAKFQETKTYKGKTARKIIEECKKYHDKRRHAPTSPYRNTRCCR